MHMYPFQESQHAKASVDHRAAGQVERLTQLLQQLLLFCRRVSGPGPAPGCHLVNSDGNNEHQPKVMLY